MRKLILSMQITLDGFAVGPDNDMSWMQPDDDEQWDSLFSLFDNIDLFVTGRGMWAGYRDYWKKALVDPGFSKNEVKYAKLAERTPHYVFSRSLKDSGWENATIIRTQAEKEIAKLKKQKGKDIQIVGGVRFAGSLINSGLVDEYRLFVNPAIIAKGKSFFAKLTQRHSLQLIEARTFRGGLVMLHYRQVSTSNTTEKKSAKRNRKTAAKLPDFKSGLGAPAQRALANAGIHTLKDLARSTEKEILSLHGMGPASLPRLRDALRAQGLTFKK